MGLAFTLLRRPSTDQQSPFWRLHCCRAAIGSLTDERARGPSGFERLGVTVGELHLYSMRHVQHHAAQLNLILRQTVDSAPLWVKQAAVSLDQG